MTVVYQGKYSHCMRIGVAVPLNSTVYRLRDAVSRETKIPMDQVLFLVSTTRCLIHCEAVLLQLSVTVGRSSTLEQLRVTYFLADMQSHSKTCFNTLKLRCSNCSRLLTGAENVSLLLLMRSRVVGSGRMLQWNLGRIKLFKTKLKFLLFPPPVCFD